MLFNLLVLSGNVSGAVKGNALDAKSFVVNCWCACGLLLDEFNAVSLAPNTNGNECFCCSDFALPTILCSARHTFSL